MQLKSTKDLRNAAIQIVKDADGEVVGRTRIQKMAYLLELAGVGSGFKFSYKHYGPFSQHLAEFLQVASLFKFVEEEKISTDWGAKYSIYRVKEKNSVEGVRKEIIDLAKKAGAIELELAATAVFLAAEGYTDAWAETSRRKPEKASKIDGARQLYIQLTKVQTDNPWPEVN